MLPPLEHGNTIDFLKWGKELASGTELIAAWVPDDLLDASLILSLSEHISPALAIR